MKNVSLTPKNWKTFQHYSDRKPAWIKLHRALLDDYAFSCLPLASQALAPRLWLLASEYENGNIKASLEEIAFRLHVSLDDLKTSLKPLVDAEFFTDASDLLAGGYQEAIVERETEKQEEKEKEKEYLSEQSSDAPKRKRISYPEDFEEFWKAYPTDPLQSKKEAYDAWKRLSPEDRILAFKGVPGFRRYCEQNPDYRPIHACRFLLKRRFDGFTSNSGAGPPPGLSAEERAKWVRARMEAQNGPKDTDANQGFGKILEGRDGIRAA